LHICNGPAVRCIYATHVAIIANMQRSSSREADRPPADGDWSTSPSPGQLAKTWADPTNLSVAEVARRAGLSASTVHRILADQVDPSVGTLREIAIACDLDLALDTQPLSDPAAAAAARALLEDGYAPSLPGVDAWIARLQRRAGSDPVAVAELAGRCSAPLLRSTTRLFAGVIGIGRLASAGAASGGQWALSGLGGFRLPGMWEPAPAPTILWCEDARVATQMLGDTELVPATRPGRATVAVAEADAALFIHSFENDGVRWVAPIQILLDGFSIGGAAAEFARREARSW
jgi:transcriptional regulator with XRE-family HTH domain